MTTKRQKGLEFQRWIKKWLEEKDWTVHNQTPMGKMIFVKGKKIFISQRNDIFGCDLICKKPNTKTLWIQATLDSGISRKIDELHKYSWNLDVDDVQIWLKRKDKKIDIFTPLITWSTPDGIQYGLTGHIIRRKFYCAEGFDYAF